MALHKPTELELGVQLDKQQQFKPAPADCCWLMEQKRRKLDPTVRRRLLPADRSSGGKRPIEPMAGFRIPIGEQ